MFWFLFFLVCFPSVGIFSLPDLIQDIKLDEAARYEKKCLAVSSFLSIWYENNQWAQRYEKNELWVMT